MSVIGRSLRQLDFRERIGMVVLGIRRSGELRRLDHPGAAFDVLGEILAPACLADVNQDGQLSPQDFNAWILAYNARDMRADQNSDGAITPADFNAWIINYSAGC